MISNIKSTFLIITLLSVHLNLNSQNLYFNKWVLGEAGGVTISFSESGVEISRLPIDANLSGNNSSICDKDGNLLFFFNGCEIIDRSLSVMLNGDGLGHNLLESEYCSEGISSPLGQGSIVLPDLLNPNLYYLFYNDFQDILVEPNFAFTPGNLYLSTIDISKNDGLGEVIIKDEIIQKDTFARFGFEATLNSTSDGWWAVYPFSNSNCYLVININSRGKVNSHTQCLGNKWNNIDLQGQSAFSPDGTKYCRFIYANGLDLFDFDPENGELSNPVHIEFDFTDTVSFAGVEFSSNSRFLYANTYNKIFQFDLDDEDIIKSRVLVSELEDFDYVIDTKMISSQLAPNGKIYVGGGAQFSHLHTINYPNCKGVNCKVDQYSVLLDSFPSFSALSLPNLPTSFYSIQDIFCDTVVMNNDLRVDEKTLLAPNPCDNEFIVNSNSSSSKKVEIFTLNGEVIYHEIMYQKSNLISTASFHNGIYLVKVSDNINKKFFMHKLVVHH